MVTTEHLSRIEAIRKRLFEAIENSLKYDGHCKSYEGRIELHWPNYFTDGVAGSKGWGISLACYVIGPSRGEHWFADTLDEALSLAGRDIYQWCQDEMDYDY